MQNMFLFHAYLNPPEDECNETARRRKHMLLACVLNRGHMLCVYMYVRVWSWKEADVDVHGLRTIRRWTGRERPAR